MEENSMAAPTSRPWYSKDMRTMGSRYYTVRNIFKGVGLDDRAHHLLSYEHVNPWNENEDLGVFDDWFQLGPRKPELIAPFVSSWMAEDIKDTTSRFQPVRKLLRKIKDCEFALAALRMGIVDSKGDPYQADDRAECIAKLGDVSALATSLQNEFQALVSSAPFKDAYSKDQACTTCSDVFLIPELVEHILDFVNVEDVLRVRQVNKSLRKIIDVACMIQRGLGLQPDLDGYLHLPLAVHPKVEHQRNFPGFSCRAEILSHPLVSIKEHSNITHDVRTTGAVPPAQQPEAKVCARIECSEGGRLPEIGTVYCDMLVCQPPITSMTMKISYFPNTDKWTEEKEWEILPIPDWGDEDNREWPVVTTAGPGLTLGEMWDAAHELLYEQTEHMYGVGLIVTFTGTVQLRYDDPALAGVGDQNAYYEDQCMAWSRHSRAIARKESLLNNKRARTYRRTMRAEMRDCKAPLLEELQAACTAIRSAEQVWREEDARDAEAAGQRKLVVDPETGWWYDDTEGDSSW
ncbi:hypothetical protein LTR15_005835 [Elasticomyces elasticus]|nr:hypothetical protein LTR15_005835 [Elasticomyces elasticus]